MRAKGRAHLDGGPRPLSMPLSVWGMRDPFSGSIMIGVRKVTSSRGQSAWVAFFLGFLGNSRPGITGGQML